MLLGSEGRIGGLGGFRLSPAEAACRFIFIAVPQHGKNDCISAVMLPLLHRSSDRASLFFIFTNSITTTTVTTLV